MADEIVNKHIILGFGKEKHKKNMHKIRKSENV